MGADAPRIDARAKVTGQARYPGDRAPADALHLKVVFTNRPHARLLRLETAAAEASPGVVAVFTSADVPVNVYGLTLDDQPVLIGLDTTGHSEVPSDISRWEADHLAVVVAETPKAAQEAAAAIEADWEDLPLAPDLDAALASDAPLVHPENGLDTNAYYGHRIRKGDMDAGWAAAAVIVESTYELPHQEHAYLQPEAGLAHVDEQGRVTVEVAGQWAHEDRLQIAKALDLDEEQVRVIYPPIGGAFGGREDVSVQIVLALAAYRLHQIGEHRPVTTTWSREESILGHHKRHRGRIETRWGADADGKIVAVQSEAWLDAGAYNYTSNKVLGNCHLAQAGPYEVPNAHIDSHAVYTHSVPAGAFRGFGGPQGSFAAEAQMNKLAEALDMDPIEIRRINAVRDGSIGITQTPLPDGVTLTEVINACAAEAATASPHQSSFSPFASLPAEPTALLRGRGFACSYKNVGFSFGFPERCEAGIVLHGGPDDTSPTSAEVHHAGAEVGQGAHTAFLQMAAEATGLPLDAVRGEFSDTASSGDSGSASASRLTWMAGNSILGAAEEADKAWRNGDRPAIGHFRYMPPPTEALDPDTGVCVPNFSYGYVAQFVELTVDRDTGHIVIDRVVSTHDVGRVINPSLLVGQIEGGVVQAHGYTLSENLHVADGRVLNPRLGTYLIPGIGDVPTTIDSLVLELPDPIGPWGARGMAEMPMMGYAPALVAALHDATGMWFDSFPLTPDRVLEALGT
ncbi:MAG: molybdopterin-dependent oxidoreductase [Actinomycetia bacterium]|nr:molybdopterin-dependent oxidoreductase [Actinomycetes bacterium]